MKSVVLVHGLAGSGKTTLGDMLLELLGGARVNADHVRSTISRDLKFDPVDREMQAYRIGKVTALAIEEPPMSLMQANHMEGEKVRYYSDYLNNIVIVDFICPTVRTRSVFGWAVRTALPFSVQIFDVWMNTITKDQCRFADTAALYEEPDGARYRIDGWKSKEDLQKYASDIASQVRPKYFV